MKKFKCHKVVEAVQLDVVGPLSGAHVEVEAGGETFYLEQEWVRRHKPEAGGYLVRYADGYMSFSPKEVFEDGYHEIMEDEPKAFFPDAPTISAPKDMNDLVGQEIESAMGIPIRGAGSADIPA